MIIDITEIEKLARKRRSENLRFIAFLKEKNKRYIDHLVMELNKYFSAEISCTACGHCCTKLRPILAESDIDQLVKVTKMTRSKFKKEYIEMDEEGDMLFKNLPCSFLKNNKCTIYHYRPEDCQEYPNLHKIDFVERIFGIMENYSICPIVFNVIEALKDRLDFKSGSKPADT
ncbi:MAG: YkgJ family cysteine cluster protein [Bacteroidales bacterium]|nr:YkgJ family cysteine cluster protein [Bacteroidales bacterium]